MQEREIFLAALDIHDPQARKVHLQSACAGDSKLLARVESLLASHEGSSQFLNTPAVEQLAEVAGADIDATILHGDGSTCEEEAGAALAKRVQTGEIPLAFLSPSKQPGSLGRLGHYEILEVIGRGAFGIVLRAFDEKLQRIVAIKMLAPEMAAASPARKRFKREAISSAALRHENVVSIYAVEDDPVPYLVMEYVPGTTLQERLDEQGPLDLPDVLRLGKQVADGLAAAHAEGLIHRDIKPGNILLEGGKTDRVKITDFGLARTADDASMTQSGVIAGTPLYMAPEQALGYKLDRRADLFSLGSVLYQMISGRPPFRAPSTMAVLKRVTEDTPRPIQEIIPETPTWMCELIGHLHAKNPDERYGSAQEVSELLGQCLTDLQAGRTPTIPPPGRVVEKAPSVSNSQTTRREVPRLWKGPVAQIAAALVLLLGVGLGVAQFLGEDDEHAENEVDNSQNASPENQNYPPGSIAYKLTSEVYEWTKPQQVVIGDEPHMLITNPFLSSDGQSLYFASPTNPAIGQEDIYVSQRAADGKSWGPRIALPPPVNSQFADGGPSVSADGRTLYFQSLRADDAEQRELWMATRHSLDEPFVNAKNLGPTINGKAWDVDPDVSADGLTLAFSSVRKGSLGKPDIWLCSRKTIDDPFGPPQNPGVAVNSPHLEIAPTLAPDGTALVFCSDRGGHAQLWMALRGSPDEPFGEARLLELELDAIDMVHPCLAVDSSGVVLYFTAKKEGETLKLWRTRRILKGATDRQQPVPYVRPDPIQWPADAPPLAIAPFTEEQAKGHQQAWADWLGVPVEKEVLLGRNHHGLDVKLSLVLIPPGEFLMGSSDEEIAQLRVQAQSRGINTRQLDWIDLEGPRRKVRITRPFYMSKHEFTTEQFRAFVEDTNYSTDAEASGKGAWKAKPGAPELDPALNWKRAGRIPQGPDSPVVNVTWNDASECCQWLSLQDAGLTFAVPTEAQWEFAVRAGTTTLWFTGDEESSLEGYANYNTNWPQNVGGRLPNAFGLYDMHGNVWEWCQDAFYNYREAKDIDPIGALEGERRILRGGSCFARFEFSNGWQEKSGARSAVRYERLPDNPLNQVGFRVVAKIAEELLQIRSSPDAQSYASGEWVDVIPLIDPELDKRNYSSFTGKNEWRIDDGELLVGQADVKSHKLVFPLDGAWKAFDFEMEVTRRAGESGFCVNVPTSNGECPIAFDWPEGIRVGMGENLKERYFHFGPAMKIGERTKLRFQVRRGNDKDVVSLWRDDRVIGEWEGDCSKYTNRRPPVHPDTRRLSIFLPDGQREFVFHQIRVRTLDGGRVTTLRPVSAQRVYGLPADAPTPADAPFAGD